MVDFANKHKTDPESFTRSRKLPFIKVFLLILRKTVKSIQIALNELFIQNIFNYTVTASAFCRARKKLKHTAFIELNNDIVNLYYDDKNSDIKRYKGYRLLGIDGSKIVLPDNNEIEKEFGKRTIKKRMSDERIKANPMATFEACYDVLNSIAIVGSLDKRKVYEANIAMNFIESFNEDDLAIFDRGYNSYEFIFTFAKHKKNYLIRCQQFFFKEVQKVFDSKKTNYSTIATLHIPYKYVKLFQKKGLPEELKVRIVKIKLSTGEDEVLITSLLDENVFKIEDFKEMYNLRWCVETYFLKLKSRLALENFTGTSVECVKQDFWSTIFISNLETIFTEDLEEEINVEKSEKYLQKGINKAVSFNAIKNLAFEIFYSEKNKDKVFKKLEKLFLMNMNVKRPERNTDRIDTIRHIQIKKSLHFNKRLRKHVF